MNHPLDNAERIEAACFTEIDSYGERLAVVSFFRLSGSIVRHCYYPRTTCSKTTFIPVDSWEYRELAKMA